MVIGFGLIGCGALIALGIGRGFEVPDEPEEGPKPRLGAIGVLIPPALLLFYALASEPLGFLITAAIMVLVAGLALGSRLSIAIPVAIVAPLLVHLAFYKLLRVPLPEGLLAAPW
jgi:putative tricarboxylic transport membrane protein